MVFFFFFFYFFLPSSLVKEDAKEKVLETKGQKQEAKSGSQK
jgi:hypothetical protein